MNGTGGIVSTPNYDFFFIVKTIFKQAGSFILRADSG
jgi:hypothetical protein